MESFLLSLHLFSQKISISKEPFSDLTPCKQNLTFFYFHCTLKSPILLINSLSRFNYHSCFYLNYFLKTISSFIFSNIFGFWVIIIFHGSPLNAILPHSPWGISCHHFGIIKCLSFSCFSFIVSLWFLFIS